MATYSIDRRTLFAGVGVAALAGVAPALAKEKRPFVINALGGLYNPNTPPPDEAQIAAHLLDARAISDAQSAGLGAINLTIGHVFGEGDPFVDTVDSIAWWSEAIRLHPEGLVLARTAEDIRAAHKARKVGLILGFQNSEMFGGDAADRIEVDVQRRVHVAAR